MTKLPKGNRVLSATLILDLRDLSHLLCLDAFIREDYYQEGNNVYPKLDVDEAFGKALTTWGQWVDKNVNPKKSFVFFRGYSPSHFR